MSHEHLFSSHLALAEKRRSPPSPPHQASFSEKSAPRFFAIGDHVEIYPKSRLRPLSFNDILSAFAKGKRAVLIPVTECVFCVCCCKRVYERDYKIDVVMHELDIAVTMLPDAGYNLFELEDSFGQLAEYTCYNFSLGDIISDTGRFLVQHAPGPRSLSDDIRIPTEWDEYEGIILRNWSLDDNEPDPGVIFSPPLPLQYASLHASSEVFISHHRHNNSSKYVGGIVIDPQVGQLVARRVAAADGCYMLSVIVYVERDFVILRDNPDYAARRIIYHRSRIGIEPDYHGLCHIRRPRSWWMKTSCKCVPMLQSLLPEWYNRDWRQWGRSEFLHLSDGTQSIGV